MRKNKIEQKQRKNRSEKASFVGYKAQQKRIRFNLLEALQTKASTVEKRPTFIYTHVNIAG